MKTLKLTKKYAKYPEYKDSGVEWLDKIPKDWSFDKLAHNLSRNDGGVWGEDDPLENGNLVLRSTEISQQGLFNLDTAITRKLSATEFNKGKLLEGDLLVTKSSGSADHLGKTGLVTKEIEARDVAFSNFMQRLRVSKNYNSKYIYYSLNNVTGREQINYWGSTTSGLVNLTASIINRFIFAIPTIPEQEKIIAFLDKKTLTIDLITEKKKRLIGVLKEKRISFINSAIINVRGEKGKLKNYIQLNPSKKIINISDPNDTVSFIPMEAISELGELYPQERKYKDVSSGFTYFRNGDVVLAKITPCYENGKAGVMKGLKNDFGFGTTEFMVLRPGNKILADYLYYVIFSDKFRKMGEVEMRGTAGQKRVTSSFVMNYELFIPDIKNQEKIIVEIKKKMKLFDAAIGKMEASISFLNEFKSSLISNVVTGKIKV
jgi:type I restriction enzyme S subunit